MNSKIRAILTILILLASVGFAQKVSTDSDISMKVQIKLAQDPLLKGGAIAVAANNGVVTLSGTLQTPKQKTRAGTLAQQVKGVKQVNNNIQIKK
jgi:hyperosmotically inducible protein